MTAPASATAEEGVEDIGKAAEVGETGPGSVMSEAVVHLPLVGIAKDLVRLVDLLETNLGIRRLVHVGVILASLSSEGALDLNFARRSLDAENFVIVAFCCQLCALSGVPHCSGMGTVRGRRFQSQLRRQSLAHPACRSLLERSRWTSAVLPVLAVRVPLQPAPDGALDRAWCSRVGIP